MDGFDEDTITGIFTSQVKRIVEEFRLMAQFTGNSNIVSYEDHMIVPHEDGKGWDILIRMELLEALPRYCSRAVLTEEETIKLGIGICRALELCQKQNIIHRNIKPQNIFVNRFGDYKLGDFGDQLFSYPDCISFTGWYEEPRITTLILKATFLRPYSLVISFKPPTYLACVRGLSCFLARSCSKNAQKNDTLSAAIAPDFSQYDEPIDEMLQICYDALDIFTESC